MRRISLSTTKQVSGGGNDGKIKSRKNSSSMIDHQRNIKQRKVSGSHAHSSGSDTAGVHLYHDALDGGSSGSYSVPRSKNSSPIPVSYSGHFSTKNDK